MEYKLPCVHNYGSISKILLGILYSLHESADVRSFRAGKNLTLGPIQKLEMMHVYRSLKNKFYQRTMLKTTLQQGYQNLNMVHFRCCTDSWSITSEQVWHNTKYGRFQSALVTSTQLMDDVLSQNITINVHYSSALNTLFPYIYSLLISAWLIFEYSPISYSFILCTPLLYCCFSLLGVINATFAHSYCVNNLLHFIFELVRRTQIEGRKLSA